MRRGILKKTLILFLVDLSLVACGYKLVRDDISKGLKDKVICLYSLKNLTAEYGVEQEFVKSLKNRFFSQGVVIGDECENADYKIAVLIKNIQIVPLSYRQGINAAHTYEYSLEISSEFNILDRDREEKKVFSLTERQVYFSTDSPASTESRKRIAMRKVIEKSIDRFIRGLLIGL